MQIQAEVHDILKRGFELDVDQQIRDVLNNEEEVQVISQANLRPADSVPFNPVANLAVESNAPAAVNPIKNQNRVRRRYLKFSQTIITSISSPTRLLCRNRQHEEQHTNKDNMHATNGAKKNGDTTTNNNDNDNNNDDNNNNDNNKVHHMNKNTSKNDSKGGVDKSSNSSNSSSSSSGNNNDDSNDAANSKTSRLPKSGSSSSISPNKLLSTQAQIHPTSAHSSLNAQQSSHLKIVKPDSILDAKEQSATPKKQLQFSNINTHSGSLSNSMGSEDQRNHEEKKAEEDGQGEEEEEEVEEEEETECDKHVTLEISMVGSPLSSPIINASTSAGVLASPSEQLFSPPSSPQNEDELQAHEPKSVDYMSFRGQIWNIIMKHVLNRIIVSGKELLVLLSCSVVS